MTASERQPVSLPAHEAAERRDWVAYFDRMEGKPPRATVLHAIKNFGDFKPSDAPLALDLGCGDGRDTEALLEADWRVWARDGHADGIRRAGERPTCRDAIEQGRLDLGVAAFAEMALPQARLVNASFSLPFCPPDEFPALWAKIDAAIVPGGRFSGQLFGDRDDWATLEDRTHLSRAETLALFDQYIFERFEEEDRPSKQSGSAHKHWHVFHIVARKP